jgi:hypothetical protein
MSKCEEGVYDPPFELNVVLYSIALLMVLGFLATRSKIS